jgi:hypothetical protein
MLREDYLAPLKKSWKLVPAFMPDILQQHNEKSGTASTSSTAKKQSRRTKKQKMNEL